MVVYQRTQETREAETTDVRSAGKKMGVPRRYGNITLMLSWGGLFDRLEDTWVALWEPNSDHLYLLESLRVSTIVKLGLIGILLNPSIGQSFSWRSLPPILIWTTNARYSARTKSAPMTLYL